MTDITEYKVVQRVPDDETAKAGAIPLGRDQVALTIGDAEDVWDAMLNASPPPGEDLVERVEFIIGDAKEALLSDEDLARAILAEIERKNDG